MRRSRNNVHGLFLLFIELDYILTKICLPKQSLVLVMDGAPSAAKLATQRIRRNTTYVRSQKR
jgi:5'-3' exonuclease